MDPAIITLCVLGVAAFLFITELIPLAVTAMAACTALGILGVLPSKAVYAGMSNSTVVLFGGMFVIGAAMFKTGLAEAIGVAVVKKAGTNEIPLMAAIMTVTIILSAVSSNTGTVACLMPVIIQGLQPGPELFTKYAPMTYTFFAGFVIVQFFMLLIGLGGCRIFAHIAKISDAILIPCIFVLCVVGSFAINNSFVDVVLMFIFGVMGYLMRKMGLNTAAVVLALILGPIGERGLRRSLTLSGNDISILFSTPICWGLIILCVLSAFSPLLMDWLKKGKAAIKG